MQFNFWKWDSDWEKSYRFRIISAGMWNEFAYFTCELLCNCLQHCWSQSSGSQDNTTRYVSCEVYQIKFFSSCPILECMQFKLQTTPLM